MKGVDGQTKLVVDGLASDEITRQEKVTSILCGYMVANGILLRIITVGDTSMTIASIAGVLGIIWSIRSARNRPETAKKMGTFFMLGCLIAAVFHAIIYVSVFSH